MVASAIFITDLQGKSIISRNYRGDFPIAKAIELFAKYLNDVDEEARKPIFHVDVNGDFESGDDVGMAGPGGQTIVYVNVSTFSGLLSRISAQRYRGQATRVPADCAGH